MVCQTSHRAQKAGNELLAIAKHGMASHHVGMTNTTAKVADLIQRALVQDRRVLLFGPPGTGKSTLATQLADALLAEGRECWCLGADPGSPAFGLPGAVALARRKADAWQVERFEALCTLDAGRFRLPLVTGVRKLARGYKTGTLLVDGPGVVRGVAGRELLAGLVDVAGIDLVLALTRPDQPPPLAPELSALGIEVVEVPIDPAARRPGKRSRARQRTRQWDQYLKVSQELTIDLAQYNCVGTPPPEEAKEAWVGRQVAVMQHNRTVAMGEVLRLEDSRLVIRSPAPDLAGDTLLIRDAIRTAEGVIESATPFAPERFEFLPSPLPAVSREAWGGPRIAGRVGSLDVNLVNGVFGDPLLHLRLRHQRRGLLFDLGESSRLPARLAHQVTDVCISHAHMDHISGFQWLLRSRLGDLPPCRLYGAPGLLQHITGFIRSYLWDRIADRGPVFEINEFRDDHLQRYRLQVGRPDVETLEAIPVVDGILREDAGFRLRAVTLDHHTPVLAFAFEPDQEIHVRKDRLIARGLEPGPWLAELKRQIAAGNTDAVITFPDEEQATVAELAADLVLIRPGKKLVYATDLADTPDNRKRLVAFAKNAHTLFCEAPFTEADATHAARHGHLTARACGEIASAAGVARLVAFHFSRRYADDPGVLYDELQAACNRVVLPASMEVFRIGEEITLPASPGEEEYT